MMKHRSSTLLLAYSVVVAAWLWASGSAVARGGGPTGGRGSSVMTSRHSSRYCETCERDSRGRITRSGSERMKFLRSCGLTHTPSGMQVDHIVPLSKGGADKVWNMQLIPKNSAKERNELK